MEDTITAIATAPGEGGIGIIRISGSEACDTVLRIFRLPSGKSVEKLDNRMLTYGNIVDDNGSVIDEAMVVYMKAPHSYTGEDVVEIQCHGSMVSLRKILQLVLAHGAVMADRGEFTKRAFLNGRLDLAEAEAVIDIIRARSDRGLDAAVSQLQGRLSGRISSIRKDLADLDSDIIAHIEYPEEDLEELEFPDLIKRVSVIRNAVARLADSASTGRILRDGLRLSIVGRPNVGKSSLLNLILNQDRAIVTDIPGTTRDTIQEYATVGGIPVILTDTAGIRETDDIIEKIGIERSRDSADTADVIIVMTDSAAGISREDMEILKQYSSDHTVAVLNKIDISDEDMLRSEEDVVRSETGISHIIRLSAFSGEGRDDLIDTIRSFVYSGEVSLENDELVTNVRHAELLRQALVYLDEASSMLKGGEALDFAETDIRSAWHLLGEITGEAVSEDIITEVFSRFCLGK